MVVFRLGTRKMLLADLISIVIIVIIIIILMHGIAHYSIHSCSPYGFFFFPTINLLFLCSFTNMNNL